MRLIRLTILLSYTFFTPLLRGQNLDKADLLFKNGGYAEAIPIYEAFLSKKPNNNAAKTKLATCYRILSRSDKAAPLLKDIVEADNARPTDFLHYAEALMMLGRYEEAKGFFKKYTKLAPDDERGKLLLENVDKIKNLRPLFHNLVVFPFLHNSDGDDNAPQIFRNGIAFASDRRTGFNILKEKNPTTGRDYVTVYYSEQTGDTSFTEPREISAKLTEINRNTSNISFTANGKQAYFCRNGNTPGRNGTYNMQIFSAETEDGTSFHNIEMLSFCTPENNYVYPSITPDGKRLYFAAERGDGFGGLDIYYVNKTKKGWSRSENLGAKINTPANEGFPFASANGKLYFCSKGHPTYGGYDIFVTQQDTNTMEWQKPVNIGPPINSPFDDISICFDKSGNNGAFTSMRGGRGDDIFLFRMVSGSLPSNRYFAADNNTPKSYNEQATSKQNVRQEEMPKNPKTTINEDRKSQTSFNAQQKKQSEDEITQQSLKKDATTPKPNTAKPYLELVQDLIDNDKLKPNKSLIAESIRFTNASELNLSADLKEELGNLAAFLKKNRRLVIEIGVHTEGLMESDKVSKQISIKRADLLVDYLKSQGIKSKRLSPHGYGRANPLKDCTNGGCSAAEDLRNRRVEIRFKKV